MRKFSGMLCLLLIISAPLLAQDKNIIMDESFIANINNWPIMNNNEMKTQLGAGSYTLESLTDKGSHVAKETGLDYSKDFSIETEVQFVEGASNSGFGIIFGFKNWDNFYEFLITETGYYQIVHEDQGIRTSTGWIRSDYVHTHGLSNNLKIVKINDWMGFYLNKFFVEITLSHLEPYFIKMIKADNFAGRRIGFVTNSKMKVQFKKLEIKLLSEAETGAMTDVLGSLLGGGDQRSVTLFTDDFSSNINNWSTLNIDTSCVQAITGGVYSFDKRDNSGRVVKQSVFISGGSDYEIQCKTKHLSGSDSSHYGLAWGFKDWDNQQQFVIDGKGNCKYQYNIYGNWHSLQASFRPEAENRLKVSRVKDSLYFFVNDAMVLKAPDLSPDGSDAGFVVFDKQKVLFDDLKITQVRSYPAEYKGVTVAEETLQNNEGPFSDKVSSENVSKDWEPGIAEYKHEVDNGTAIWNEYYLNPLDNFSISEKVKWIKGDSTQAYGLIWGFRNWDNYNDFLISKNGFFKCEIIHNKTVISTGWRRFSAFAKDDENTLEVKRLGSFAEYYINGQLAATMPFYELYGYFDGIFIYGKQTVGLRNFTVRSIPVERPELEPGHLIFKDNYETAEKRPDATGSDENQTFKISGSRLYLSAQFPELSDDTEDGGEAEYPNNKTLCYVYKDVLPIQLNNGASASAFSVETTVGLVRSNRNWGAGIRVGDIDFYVDSKGNFTIGDQKPAPIKDDEKPSTSIYKLKVLCTVTGRMEFYINGKMAGSIQKFPENRNAGPVISAFNKPSEAWFDGFIIRSYDNDNL